MPGRKRGRSVQRSSRFGGSVFINCPFDRGYWPMLEAIVFCVLDCGFEPRSAWEQTDSGKVRLHKIRDLIRTCKYAIHDLSRVELSPTSGLPRFNMPFELGVDLGARFYGPKQLRSKRCLILEGKQYASQKVISDLAGQDPRYHNNLPSEAINEVRAWLQGASDRKTIPGPMRIKERFAAFSDEIAPLATESGLDRRSLTYLDYVHIAEEWLRTAP